MTEISLSELKKAVEEAHRVTATFNQSVLVHEATEGQTLWYGTVHVFDLDGHPEASRAYAWCYEREDGERRTFAILHLPPITSPMNAVRAAIVQERRMDRYGHSPTVQPGPSQKRT